MDSKGADIISNDMEEGGLGAPDVSGRRLSKTKKRRVSRITDMR